MWNKVKNVANKKWPFSDTMTLFCLILGLIWFMYFYLAWNNDVITIEDIAELSIPTIGIFFVARLAAWIIDE